MKLPNSKIGQDALICLINRRTFLESISRGTGHDSATLLNSLRAFIKEGFIVHVREADDPANVKYYKLTKEGTELAIELKRLRKRADKFRKKWKVEGIFHV